ncbi:MAG: SUMF1/EgtB/PvdO family nonheme iron enzyme [Gemmataceae bacterium]
MTTEAFFLQAILSDPAANDSWLVLGDWLEEQGQLERAELVRLQVQLRLEKRWRPRARPEKRVQELLAAGVRPCIPSFVNSVGMELALVPPGQFWMGSTRQQTWADVDEFPRHRVEITQPFYLGVHAVTQQQFEQVTGMNPSFFRTEGEGRHLIKHINPDPLPVENVSYEDAIKFCRSLSELPEEAARGRIYRLPSEAEWEYACRACICSSAYSFGSRLTRKQARFGGMGGGHPVPVGSYRPNLFGLHDMHGNVWEWCADWYDTEYYSRSPVQAPPGPRVGHRRVLRGGGWSTNVELCRSGKRGHNSPTARHRYNGFRLALSVTLS